jgi:hypothetical protein
MPRPSSDSSTATPWAVPLLTAGVILSAILTAASVRITPFSLFSVIFHLIMLTALSSPFVVLYVLASRRRTWTVPLVTFGSLFIIDHLYLIYVTYTRPPREFGYIGLIFAPVLEAVVAIPVGLLIILIAKRSGKR